jgi:hypothetical protein
VRSPETGVSRAKPRRPFRTVRPSRQIRPWLRGLPRLWPSLPHEGESEWELALATHVAHRDPHHASNPAFITSASFLHSPCGCSRIARFKWRSPFDFRVSLYQFRSWPGSTLYHLPGRRSASHFGSEAMRIRERLVPRPMNNVEKCFTPLRNWGESRGGGNGLRLVGKW